MKNTYQFKYGLKYRPPTIGSVPRVMYEYDDRYRDRSRYINFGIIYTERELTAEEIYSYELVDMNNE